MADARSCSVCKTLLDEPATGADPIFFTCPRCGKFGLTRTAEAVVRDALSGAGYRQVAAVGHGLRRMQSSNKTPVLDSNRAKRLIATASLPSPQEQADNLLLHVGDHTGPGEYLPVTSERTGLIIGSASAENWAFVVDGLAAAGRANVNGIPAHGGAEVRLTFAGWTRYEELKRGAPSGRNAFMAMPYGNEILDRLVTDYFRPAVKQTGFDLKRLDDEPQAGLIDARMMLAIQGSWFLVADVTHGNQGAYWEAGYASGLRKPVIYTCERAAWDDRRSHFDTNHHLHVLWDAADMTAAVRELKATIRFTIPEAKQQDDA